MLSAQDRQIVQEVRRRVTAITPVIDVCVFGSSARGDATPESDLGVFIEAEQLSPTLREKIFELAWEVGFEKERVILTIVTTPEKLAHGAIGANPLIREIERDGVHV